MNYFTTRMIRCAPLLLCGLLLCAVLPAFGDGIHREIGEYMSAQVRVNDFAGSILIANKDGILECVRYGSAIRPCAQADRYAVGSIAKQFTAVSVLQLQAEKKLSLRDSVCRYIPDCPAVWQPITVRDLLTQTDGIPELPLMNRPRLKSATNIFSVVNLLRTLPMEGTAGEHFRSGDSGYAVLDEVIENVSHEPYQQYLQRHIFTPLGMDGTGFAERNSRYQKNGSLTITPDDRVESSRYVEGRMYSTAEDLFRWDRSFYSGALIPESLANEMFQPQIDGQGFGWTILNEFDRYAETQGSGLDYVSASIRRFPQSRTCIIVLSNGGGVDAATISHDLAAIVFGKHYDIPSTRRLAKIDTAVYASYAGTYLLARQMPLRVFAEGGRLMIQGAGRSAVELLPESETRFFVKGIDSQISFVNGPRGNAVEMVLQQGGRVIPAFRTSDGLPTK